jgi:pimeloyl-ACP methyl ester carboxylesterase
MFGSSIFHRRQVLNTLEKDNLFVIPLDDERCWYRYHHLFADLLMQRLRTQQSDLLPELHNRATAWFANIAELSANHRVYAVDGIGDAGKSIAECLIEKRSDYAEWLREVFDGLNIEKAHLLGHSYGGWLALNMALAYPERLRKIVLLAPAASIYPMNFLTNLGLRLPFKIRIPARSVFKMIASKGTVFEETFIHLLPMSVVFSLGPMLGFHETILLSMV